MEKEEKGKRFITLILEGKLLRISKDRLPKSRLPGGN
jgi:hypothetical protein